MIWGVDGEYRGRVEVGDQICVMQRVEEEVPFCFFLSLTFSLISSSIVSLSPIVDSFSIGMVWWDHRIDVPHFHPYARVPRALSVFSLPFSSLDSNSHYRHPPVFRWGRFDYLCDANGLIHFGVSKMGGEG